MKQIILIGASIWCRFPILSGGFEKELAEMRDWAAEQKPNSRKGKIGF